MSNEKYVNYYVETMTGVMNDAVMRNISLQANAKISEDIISDQVEKIGQLENQIEQLGLGKDDKYDELQKILSGHLETIGGLNRQVEELNKMKAEYENVKHQVNHVDTFRNELVKEREEHQKTRVDLENKIASLSNSQNSSVEELKNNYNNSINELNKKIEDLKALHNNAIESLKVSQNTAIEELVATHNDTISSLNDQIEYLQLTPAKRKKVDEMKTTLFDVVDSPKTNTITKDGGSF
jgi:DNA repair exonuclease SbcCD ATPase subunit